MKYKLQINDKTLTEDKIYNYISECKNLPDILNLLNLNLFSIERLEPPFGELRSEHLIKALEIADYFKNDEIISKIPLLKKIYSVFASKKQNKKDVVNKSHIDFYKSRFPDLQISNSGWNNVMNKISLETFISIDIISEKAVIIWNSLLHFLTTNSCSGHYDANRYFSFSDFYLKFDANTINISNVSDILKSAFAEFDSNIFKIDIEINDNQLGIKFFQIPPEKWIAENDKIPIIDLCTEYFEQFKVTFNTDKDFEDFNIKKYTSVIEAVEFVRKNLWKYINQMNLNLKISDSEDNLFWKIFQRRCLIFEETYKDYYTSDKALNNINLFWEKIEDTGNELQ